MSRRRRFILGGLIGLIALLARYALIPVWGDNYPFFTFFPAVLLSAWYGGLASGLATVAVAALGAWYFLPPLGLFAFRNWGDVLAWVLFVGISAVIVSLTAAVRRERRRTETARDAARSSERQLRQDDARYRSLVGSIASIVWRTDPTGSLIEASTWGDVTGQGPEEYRGWGWLEALHPQDRDATAAAWRQAIEDRVPAAVEFRLRHRDGSYRWMSVRAVPIFDDAGQVNEWVGTVTDIDDRRTADETRARLVAIVDSSNDAIVGKTLDGIVTNWNAGAERLFGYTADEMIGQPISRLIPPDRPNEIPAILNAIRHGDRVEHYETQRMRKDGQRIHVSLTVSPIKDATGRIIGASKIARDVTERKQAQEQQRRNEERTRRLLEFNQAVVENMAEGLYTVDRNGVATFMNPAAERIFGWGHGELIGRKMHEATHYKHADGTPFPAEECAGLRVLEGGVALANHEDVFVRQDGSLFPVVYSSSPISSEGEIIGLVVVFRDITKERRAATEREELLAIAETARAAAEAAAIAEREAREAAEAASRAKDAFLATVSHELRTPLSPILTWARILRQPDLDPQRLARGVEVIERAARSQAQLIEDLLDVSRIVAGKMRLEVRPVNLGLVIESAVDVVRPAADAKSVRLELRLDSQVGTVLGDAERLQQVVWNLVSNAVKFTPKGGSVQVVLERANSHVEIAVSDTGQGIEPEFLAHVFERFRQADARASRIHGGLGLGLAIVRHIVEAHGGTVHAESSGAGKGAVFTVKLSMMGGRQAGETGRRHLSASLIAEAQDVPRLDGLRVLLVDDDPDSNEAVRGLLELFGADVQLATSTAHARHVLASWTPDVLVSDVGMPGEDGYAFIASVRANDGEVGQIPAVALTAYASREDKVRLLSAGFQAHVPKPVDAAELVAVMASLARSTGKL